MTNKTSEDFERQRSKQVARMSSILDYIFGILFAAAGIFSLIRFKEDTLMIAFGVIAILYGIWRIYRGYKKSAVQ